MRAALGGKSRADDWIGVLDDMGTQGDGKAYVRIKIDGDIKLKTWNNAISDTFDHTLVGQHDALFSILADLKEGDKVVFSGKFFAAEKDGIEESSISEDGAMDDPEFIMKFTKISKR